MNRFFFYRHNMCQSWRYPHVSRSEGSSIPRTSPPIRTAPQILTVLHLHFARPIKTAPQMFTVCPSQCRTSSNCRTNTKISSTSNLFVPQSGINIYVECLAVGTRHALVLRGEIPICILGFVTLPAHLGTQTQNFHFFPRQQYLRLQSIATQQLLHNG